MGHDVLVISPDLFRVGAVPDLSRNPPGVRVDRRGGHGCSRRSPRRRCIWRPKGPVCLAARRWCLQRDFPFTTAYHTQFPDYVAARTGVNPEWVWRYIKWFHGPAHVDPGGDAVDRRDAAGAWVDVRLRSLGPRGRSGDVRRGGVPDPAIEIAAGAGDAVCRAGRGREEYRGVPDRGASPAARSWWATVPALTGLKAKFPHVSTSSGPKFGADLAAAYAAADVFVFPSKHRHVRAGDD